MTRQRRRTTPKPRVSPSVLYHINPMAAGIDGGSAAHLAKGAPLTAAVPAAKASVEGAMRHGIALGKGHRPLDHFWNTRRD